MHESFADSLSMQKSFEKLLKNFPGSNQYIQTDDWGLEMCRRPTMQMLTVESPGLEPQFDP
jgi:hypothetical protein